MNIECPKSISVEGPLKMFTKLLVSGAIVVGSLAGAAPTSADPTPPAPSPVHQNPYGGLGRDDQVVPPVSNPGLDSEIERGLQTALSVRPGHHLSTS